MTKSLIPAPPRALSADAGFDLVNDWLAAYRADDASEATITAYRIGIEVWIEWLSAHRPPGLVSPPDVDAFRSALKRRYSTKTVNLRLSAVKSFYRWMVTTGRLPVSPATEIKSAHVADSQLHKRDELADDEVLRVLATCDAATPIGVRDLAILTLMAYGGLREIEAHRASLGDLKTQSGRMTLTVSAKRRTRVVVVKQDREGIIRDWLAERSKIARLDPDAPLFVSFSRRSLGARLSTSAIRRMVKSRYIQAGVVGARKSTHSLRHSAITRVVRGGGTPLQAQEFAGHSSFDTTMIYYHEVNRLDHPAEDLIKYQSTSDDR